MKVIRKLFLTIICTLMVSFIIYPLSEIIAEACSYGNGSSRYQSVGTVNGVTYSQYDYYHYKYFVLDMNGGTANKPTITYRLDHNGATGNGYGYGLAAKEHELEELKKELEKRDQAGLFARMFKKW